MGFNGKLVYIFTGVPCNITEDVLTLNDTKLEKHKKSWSVFDNKTVTILSKDEGLVEFAPGDGLQASCVGIGTTSPGLGATYDNYCLFRLFFHNNFIHHSLQLWDE